MSLSHLTSPAQPNPSLNPRFNSLYVDTVLTAGSITDMGGQKQSFQYTAATTPQSIPASWGGQLIVVNPPTSANMVLNLPLASTAVGASFDFLFQQTSDGTHTVEFSANSSDAGHVYGSVQNGPTTGVTCVSLSAGKTNVIWGTAGLVGDRIKFTAIQGSSAISSIAYWQVSAVATGTSTFSVS